MQQLLWAAAALRLAAEPPGCAGELARALEQADTPGLIRGETTAGRQWVADEPTGGDEHMVHARRTAVLFKALPEECVRLYRSWQRKQLPQQCKAAYDKFAKLKTTPSGPLALPAWRGAKLDGPASVLYLVSASSPSSLPVLLRSLDALYREQDQFVYLVDTSAHLGYRSQLESALKDKYGPVPNVRVQAAEHHAMLFLWPRMQNVITAMTGALADKTWTHVYHLSESDYPLHGRPPPARGGAYDERIYTEKVNREDDFGRGALDWSHWKERTAVFDCEGFAVPDHYVRFPADYHMNIEGSGMRMARGGEWFGFPRSVVEYMVAPESKPQVDEYIEIMRHRWSSDEVFWPTLLRSIPGLEAAVPIEPGWFVLWDMPVKDANGFNNGHSPDVFEGAVLDEHRPAILASDRLFVRKVTLPGSVSLLSSLDARQRVHREETL